MDLSVRESSEIGECSFRGVHVAEARLQRISRRVGVEKVKAGGVSSRVQAYGGNG